LTVEIRRAREAPLAAWLLLAIVAAGCRTAPVDQGPPLVQPGAPGEATREITPAEAINLSGVQYTPADVRFMQGMIGHHAQALEMTTLVASHTANEDIRKLALRIEVSQKDEIRAMQDWLKARGERVPDPHAHHAGAALMPGMLTSAEMERLAAARAAGFDRLFLELMIKHHDGALTMVKELFASPGAGQEVDVFEFASEVDADQRMEIARMAAMLNQVKELK
jgi:uncharacterized protein (DUF305 family)